MTAKRQILLNRTSYRRKGGLTGTGVNLQQRKLPANPYARTLMCRRGCKAKFAETEWLEKHERDFHGNDDKEI